MKKLKLKLIYIDEGEYAPEYEVLKLDENTIKLKEGNSVISLKDTGNDIIINVWKKKFRLDYIQLEELKLLLDIYFLKNPPGSHRGSYEIIQVVNEQELKDIDQLLDK